MVVIQRRHARLVRALRLYVPEPSAVAAAHGPVRKWELAWEHELPLDHAAVQMELWGRLAPRQKQLLSAVSPEVPAAVLVESAADRHRVQRRLEEQGPGCLLAVLVQWERAGRQTESHAAAVPWRSTQLDPAVWRAGM